MVTKYLAILGLAAFTGGAFAQSVPTPELPGTDQNETGKDTSQDRNKGQQGDKERSGTAQERNKGQRSSKSQGNDMFGSLDIDGNGSLSREETRNDDSLTRNFQQLDTNRDSKLSQQEYSASLSASGSSSGKGSGSGNAQSGNSGGSAQGSGDSSGAEGSASTSDGERKNSTGAQARRQGERDDGSRTN